MPWINSSEAGFARDDDVATLGLLVFPRAFFLAPGWVLLPVAFFSAETFLGGTFLVTPGLPAAFFGLAARGAAALDRVFRFFAVCVGVAIS